MRKLVAGLLALVACADAPPPAPAPVPTPLKPAPQTSTPPPPSAETVTRDTPRATQRGNTFTVPAAWTVSVRGPATFLETPEKGSRIVLVDVGANTADEAVAAAWTAIGAEKKWPLKTVNQFADKDGWAERREYVYLTSPNEKRRVTMDTYKADGIFTVVHYDMADAVSEKRLAALELLAETLLPKGYARETFAGKKANKLDAARIAALSAWVEEAMKALKVPGVSFGIVQDGKTVFAGGLGVRELGKPQKPDADTLFMIASNTKALSTLLLAQLVDEKKLAWDTPVTEVLPDFKLGDAETTRQVQVKHLVCACTGLPRQDFEWLFEYRGATAKSSLATLATVQPTSKFGEMFQYSNFLAGAGGYVGGHVVHPKMELGAAYDAAMKTRVFDPLGMKSTTFDYAKALAGNHAFPHGTDVDGKAAKAVMDLNYSVIPLRPAGAGWSNVRDLLAYVSMELAEGKLPDGKKYIDRAPLLERRATQVRIGADNTYGMGLEVNTRYGTPVVHHGGHMIGFHSDMMWLPEHGVGAVVLTNGETGRPLQAQFRQKLLEVLFDGQAQASAAVTKEATSYFDELAADRKRIEVPADPGETAKLAKRYRNPALGTIAVLAGGKTIFDFLEWRSEVATRKNPDGTVSFVTIDPGAEGFDFVVGKGEKRTLTTRDGQHEYVFSEE